MWVSGNRSFEDFSWRVRGGQFVVVERRTDNALKAALVDSILDEHGRCWVNARDGSWRAELWREGHCTHVRRLSVLPIERPGKTKNLKATSN